jgi:serine/threonine protein kinase
VTQEDEKVLHPAKSRRRVYYAVPVLRGLLCPALGLVFRPNMEPVAPPEPDAPWNKLGEYRIVRDIAEGTFGMVKGARPSPAERVFEMCSSPAEAIHTVTGVRVAMKCLPKGNIQRGNAKTRVRKEVEYMRLLRHPHIVRL